MTRIAWWSWLCLGALPAQAGWVQSVTAPQPLRRGWHMLAHDMPRGVTVLFGGAWHADTWEWNGTAWSQRSPLHSPPARCCSGFALDLARGRIVMFGGQAPAGDLADTWEYDGIDWTQVVTTSSPSPRRLPGFAYDPARGRLLLFGGGNASLVMSGDTWEWSGSAWTQLSPVNAPLPRWGLGMVTDFVRGRIVLHGGSNTTGGQPASFRDTWTWNGNDWTPVTTAAQPPPVVSFGMTFDWLRGATVLFGGDPLSNETWLFTGDDWVRDPAPAPPARFANMIAFDLPRGRTVLFGGRGTLNVSLGDTWQYAAPALARWTPYGSGCAGSAGLPRLQPSAGSRPVLGQSFVSELTGAPANAAGAIAFGFSQSAWSGGPLPASLAPFGMPGCTLFASPEALVTVRADAAGRATSSWLLPNVPAFAALQFFAQALVLDPGVNPLGATVSGAGAAQAGML